MGPKSGKLGKSGKASPQGVIVHYALQFPDFLDSGALSLGRGVARASPLKSGKSGKTQTDGTYGSYGT